MGFRDWKGLTLNLWNIEPFDHRRCPDGEIGRRTAFRWQRSQGCASSNLVLGTKKKTQHLVESFLVLPGCIIKNE